CRQRVRAKGDCRGCHRGGLAQRRARDRAGGCAWGRAHSADRQWNADPEYRPELQPDRDGRGHRRCGGAGSAQDKAAGPGRVKGCRAVRWVELERSTPMKTRVWPVASLVLTVLFSAAAALGGEAKKYTIG